ncbi:MAG: acylphosphatase [Verrucomicrobiota bacterium]
MGKEKSRILNEVWFSGRVQGVGFRYETTKIANGYEVTGYVENLADGRVHLVANGTEEEVRQFIEAVCDGLSEYIRDTEIRVGDAKDPFEGFQLKI